MERYSIINSYMLDTCSVLYRVHLKIITSSYYEEIKRILILFAGNKTVFVHERVRCQGVFSLFSIYSLFLISYVKIM